MRTSLRCEFERTTTKYAGTNRDNRGFKKAWVRAKALAQCVKPLHSKDENPTPSCNPSTQETVFRASWLVRLAESVHSVLSKKACLSKLSGKQLRMAFSINWPRVDLHTQAWELLQAHHTHTHTSKREECDGVGMYAWIFFRALMVIP